MNKPWPVTHSLFRDWSYTEPADDKQDRTKAKAIKHAQHRFRAMYLAEMESFGGQGLCGFILWHKEHDPRGVRRVDSQLKGSVEDRTIFLHRASSLMVLTRQRCLIHTEREAAARCGRCGRFFCRECVTEHAGQMTCAACLREIAAASRHRALKPRFWLGPLVASWRAVQLTCSVLAAWFFFHLLGHWLINLPDEFHAGNLWETLSGQDNSGDNGD